MDPIFTRQLKSFDTSSMDQFFLNAFPLNKKLEIGMFCGKKELERGKVEEKEDPLKMEVEEFGREPLKEEEEAKQEESEGEKMSEEFGREIEKAHLVLMSKDLFPGFKIIGE